jgi:hypothetical protein
VARPSVELNFVSNGEQPEVEFLLVVAQCWPKVMPALPDASKHRPGHYLVQDREQPRPLACHQLRHPSRPWAGQIIERLPQAPGRLELALLNRLLIDQVTIRPDLFEQHLERPALANENL